MNTATSTSFTARRTSLMIYPVAVALVLLTLGLRLFIGSRMEGPTLILFTVPILLSAYWGGFGAGLVATCVAFFGASYYLLPPLHSFDVAAASGRWHQAILFLAGSLISAVCEALRRARRRVEASEELFSKSFRLSPDCVAVVRLRDRTVIQANDVLCQLWGSTPEEIIGKPTREYTNWLNEEERLAFMKTLEEQGECLNYETTLRLTDGRRLRFNISARRISFSGEACILSVMRDVTERRRAEAAASHLASIVAFSDDAIISKDLAGIVTSWNAGAEKIFGFSADEMVGQPIMRLIPMQRQNEEAEILEHVSRGESIRHFETVRLRKDGGLIDVSVTVSAIKDAAGVVVGASKVARDITGRKKAEAAVRESEGRYRTLFEYAPDGIVIADPQSTYIDANPSVCRMLGYTRDELIGLNATDIVASTEVEHIDPALSTIKAKSAYHREWRFRRKDGAIFEAEVIATMMPGGNLMGMIRDITERRLAEKAIRDSEEYFRFLNDLVEATRTLADPALIMAVMTRMLGEHLGASRCAYADVEKDGERFTILHDYTDGCASTVGNYQLSLFGPRAVATLQRGETLIIRNVGAELKPDEGAEMFNAIGIQSIITCPLVKDGGLRAMMAVHQTTPRDWKPGEISVVQDVVERCWATIERRNAEEKIRQLNVELEQRVIERTSQLESANKELEAFSYSVSHDLRAPLRGIDGFARILQEDYAERLDGEGRRVLGIICGESKRMGQLIDDLLGFSRMSRKELDTTAVDMEGLAQSVFDGLMAAAPKHAPTFVLKPLPEVSGDRATLRQVLVNLLGNAVKFTARQAEPVIEMGGASADGVATFYVKDNGVGFDEKYRAKLFGVFQRLHSEDEFEGTGVGLALVQRIIHRHGGKVWAEGRLGAGATFYFTLPEAAKELL